MPSKHLPKLVLFFVELPPIIVLGVVANVAFVYRDDQSIVYDELSNDPTHPKAFFIKGRILVADHS
jgi:hypothetical protein